MKKYSIQIAVFFIALTFSQKVYSFTQVGGCGEITTSLTCVEVTACMDLSSKDTYYLLVNDVSSGGTCFSVKMDNFVFDLNGHKISYAQSGTGNAFHDQWENRDNIIITNGTIEGGAQENSHAMFWETDAAHNLEFSFLDITARGLQTCGIAVQSGRDLSIHDINLNLLSTKDVLTHYGAQTVGIALTGRSGKVEVYNNRITGTGMKGVGVTSCGNWDASSPMLIHGNYISMESPVPDGYAISLEGLHNVCSDGTKIYDNIIDQVSGRGILVAGWNGANDYGPGNVEIFNNTVKVKEGWNVESDVPGNSYGMRLRFGAHDINTHHNYIFGQAGSGLGLNSDPNKDKTTVKGVFISSGEPNGNNFIFEGNYIEANTNDINYDATAMDAKGDEGPNASLNSIVFKYNKFKSNYRPLRVTGARAGRYSSNFEGDTIIKGDDPIDFISLYIGYWFWGAIDHNFLNIKGENGADVHDHYFRVYSDTDGTAHFENDTISWTLKILAQDLTGSPLSGADVEIKDQNGVVAGTGTTDSNGIFKTNLVEKSYSGTNATETNFIPYSVTVSYASELTQIRSVDLTQTKTEVFQFSALSNTNNIAPFIDEGSPVGTIPPMVTEADLVVSTNENANCKYSTTAGTSYGDMTGVFTTTGATSHTTKLTELNGGTTYNYYIRCQDSNGNTNTDDYLVSFWVAHGYTSNSNPNPNSNETSYLISVTGGCSLNDRDVDYDSGFTMFVMLIMIIIIIRIMVYRSSRTFCG